METGQIRGSGKGKASIGGTKRGEEKKIMATASILVPLRLLPSQFVGALPQRSEDADQRQN